RGPGRTDHPGPLQQRHGRPHHRPRDPGGRAAGLHRRPGHRPGPGARRPAGGRLVHRPPGADRRGHRRGDQRRGPQRLPARRPRGHRDLHPQRVGRPGPGAGDPAVGGLRPPVVPHGPAMGAHGVSTRAQLFRATLVLFAALVLQVTIMSDLRIIGALGDVMLALTIAAGLTGGADRGVTWGFATGLLYDLVLDTPFGLSALTYALVGYAVGLAGSALMRTSGWWPVGVGAGAGAGQGTLYTPRAHPLGG